MWAVAVAAMAFTSCSKDETFDVVPEPEQVTINITAGGEEDAETRTHLDGTAQIKWDATGEALQVLEQTTSLVDAQTEANPTISADGLTAKFSVKLPQTTATSFDYYAIYPAANFISNSNSAVNKFKMELPKDQTPVAESFDPKADLLVSKKVTLTTQPTNLTFQFQRPITVVQLQLMGITAGEQITSVVFENTAAALAGRLYYDWSTNTVTEYGYQGQDSKMINMTCDRVATGTDNVYFTSFPAELTDFTVTVSTDKATYTKTVTGIAQGKLSFKAGHKANVRVSGMTRKEVIRDTYTYLTDASVLKEGYKVIIASDTFGSVMLMGAQEGSKRAATTTKTSINDATRQINILPEGTRVFTLEQGTEPGSFALFDAVENKYLYATGAKSTDLMGMDEITANSSWIATKTGTSLYFMNCSFKATNRRIYYSSQSTNFGFYAKSSNVESGIFYKEGAPKTPLATPANLTATVAEGTNVANVTWEAVANAGTYTVTCGTNSQEVNTNSAVVENLAWETTSTIEVVANPKAGDELYKSSAAATTTATVGKNPVAGKGTIKELRTLMQDETYIVKDYCGGSVDAYVAAVYSNKVAVIDNTNEAGSGMILYQATLPAGGVKEGQEITINLLNATRSVYNGLLQIKGAEVTVKNATPAEIVKPTITATEFNTGNYQGMYVRINATTPATAGTWGEYPQMTGSDNTIFNTRVSDANLKAQHFSASKTGVIGGIADCFKGQQIVPQTAEDVKDFLDATPRIEFASTTITAESTATAANFAFTRNEFAATSTVTATKNAEATWVTSLDVVGDEIQCGFAANETTEERTATITVNLDGNLAATLTLKQAVQGAGVTQTIIITWSDVAAANELTTNTDLPASITNGVSPFKFEFNKNTGTTAPRTWSNNTELRLYKNNKFTISGADASVKINEIKFNTNLPATANIGTYKAPVWTGDSNSIEFTVSSSAKTQKITTITITYTK